MATYGYSGTSFDRWVGEHSSQSNADNTLNKMQHQFWVAKQTILRRIGKKEDECIIAADAELDAKLELFLSIQETCSKLHSIVDQYQERLQVLAQEEYLMGTFLRNYGELDKTRAGKMMCAVGKAMSYTSQQRTSLRSPLSRLHQELETFCQRAIEDTSFTVNEMEKCRNDYRGALLWMKDVSQQLDPDTFKQLEKFRRVQSHVRNSKSKFDRHKLACLQKIDLLAAARCNMFSHGLIVYQDNFAAFWQRTSKALTSVSDAYKGYQPYEFTFIKELSDSSAKSSAGRDASPEPQFEFQFESEFHDEKPKTELDTGDRQEADLLKGENNLSAKKKSNKEKKKSNQPQPSSVDNLIGLDLNHGDQGDDLLLELASLNLGNHQQSASMDAADCDLLLALEQVGSSQHFQADFDQVFGASKAPNVASSQSFQANFDQVFGTTKASDGGDWGSFLPSQLLSNDLFNEPEAPLMSMNSIDLLSKIPKQSGNLSKQPSNVKEAVPVKKTKGKDMSSWYDVFSDLDPLANPDALGGDKDDDRNC